MLVQEVIIKCEDGFNLSGTLYKPTGIKSAVMIAPATGIKQQFYSAFARFLCESGYAVLTFDNRGIGQSIDGFLNNGNPSLTSWGKLDMTAALEFLKIECPDAEYHLIGHSAGGQLVGLMQNAHEIKSIFNFGSSSGSLKFARYPFRLKSSFWLNFYIPISNLIFGHTKSQWVGMGEPLPKNVGKEWTKWCNGKGYIKVDLDTKIKEHLYNEMSMNTLWVHAEDDEIANYETVKDMIRVHPKIQSEILTLSPKEFGFKDIGHMKFFSKKKSKLWSIATEWLNRN